ncbi:hypothetical protein [uncultured Tateyamaria sp.]|uniref:hypothetical protein n=1 Tax=uncultured Tateyamaria sp. TaxID=455651 RepID=UPI00261C3612|nr:hypothetical protein [uncultured Tateyamaria sp.]
MIDVHFQGTDVLRLFGLVSALLSICAFLPYIRDMLAGRTRPQRASWLIWSVLGSIALASQVYEGAMQSLWFAGFQVGGTITVLALSIRKGQGVFFNQVDIYILCAAAAGLVLWALTDTAVYALAITISISLMGGSVTVLKAYRDPDSETLSMWFTSCIAAWFAILSVGGVNWILLAYPIYLFVLNGAIVMAIMLGRAVRQEAQFFAAE